MERIWGGSGPGCKWMGLEAAEVCGYEREGGWGCECVRARTCGGGGSVWVWNGGVGVWGVTVHAQLCRSWGSVMLCGGEEGVGVK